MSELAAGRVQTWTARPAGAARRRGLSALAAREVLRVLKLWTQTIVAPVLSSFLFILVFGLSLSGRIKQVDHVPTGSSSSPG